MKKWIYSVATFVGTMLLSTAAFAQDGSAAPGLAAAYAGAGLAVGVAALGVGLGQGRAVSAAVEGIGRNPNAAAKIQTPMILGLAFMEFLVIMAFIIAIILVGK